MTFMTQNVDNLFELGHAIHTTRRIQGITQAALASKAGVSRAFVSSLERGMKPRAELFRVMQVIQALGLGMTLEPTMKLTFDEALDNLIESKQA